MDEINISEENSVLPQQVAVSEINQSKDDNPQLNKTQRNYNTINTWDSAGEVVETRLGLRYLYNGFRFLGVYSPKKNKSIYAVWAIIINICVTIYLPTAFVMGIVQVSDEDMAIGDFLTSLQVAINVIGCSIKIVLMFFLLPKLLECEKIFEKLDKRCTSDEERAAVRKFIGNGNRFVVLFAIAYWSYSTSTCISAVIFGRLPYNIYNPLVDPQESSISFVIAVFMEMLPVDIACFQQVVDDSYAVIYVNILRTHMEALLLRIQRMNGDGSTNTEEENVEELKLCIIDHKNIIELYDRIAPVISITIFVQFTITASLLGSTLINILLFATNVASMVASCFYVLAVVVEVFPLCYYAQCLMDENARLADVIFHSNWTDQSKNYRKMLIFFIQRSQKTIEFTAGKLFPITLNSFLGIAKFSFSLYTLIKEMDIKERYGLQ